MAETTYPKRRMRRFRRGAQFVAVKPLRLNSKVTIEVGEIIPPGLLRLYHLQKLWRQVRIAELDDPWTEGAVAGWAKRVGVDKIEIRPMAGHEAPPKATKKKRSKKKAEAPPPPPEPEPEPPADDPPAEPELDLSPEE